MKLVCFPHYTCGGLICDIQNQTYGRIGKSGGILNQAHSIGKIGDSESVFEHYDSTTLINTISNHYLKTSWVGTHCWPGALPLEKFESIVNITTMTWPSKVYRWLRSYHWYFLPRWQDLQGMELLDKTRETAKNYLIPFRPVFADNVVNIEFAEIVEESPSFKKLFHDTELHLLRWKHTNKFLYEENLWNNSAVSAIYQADVEQSLRTLYVYE